MLQTSEVNANNTKIMTSQEYDNLPSYDNWCNDMDEFIDKKILEFAENNLSYKNNQKKFLFESVKEYIKGPFRLSKSPSNKYAIIMTGSFIENDNNEFTNKDDICFTMNTVIIEDDKLAIEERGELIYTGNPNDIEEKIIEISNTMKNNWDCSTRSLITNM